jgi:hypothetical protein
MVGPATAGTGVAGLGWDQNSASDGGNVVGAAGVTALLGPSWSTVLWMSLRDHSTSPTTSDDTTISTATM